MKLLLDTCTFLWIAINAPQLSARARVLFVDPANEVYLSAVSAWEIGVKHQLGTLPLPEPPDRFVPRNREAHGIDALSFDEAAALQAARLPALHRDPFDRALVGQAVVHGLAILTPDPAIGQYAVRSAW